MQSYTSMTPEGIGRGRMLIYIIQSEGLVNNYSSLLLPWNQFSALKNCMNVCPGPQELYTSKHMEMNTTRRDCITYTVPCIP